MLFELWLFCGAFTRCCDKRSDVSEEQTAHIFRVTELFSCWVQQLLGPSSCSAVGSSSCSTVGSSSCWVPAVVQLLGPAVVQQLGPAVVGSQQLFNSWVQQLLGPSGCWVPAVVQQLGPAVVGSQLLGPSSWVQQLLRPSKCEDCRNQKTTVIEISKKRLEKTA